MIMVIKIVINISSKKMADETDADLMKLWWRWKRLMLKGYSQLFIKSSIKVV
jgi:hypothetical protein